MTHHRDSFPILRLAPPELSLRLSGAPPTPPPVTVPPPPATPAGPPTMASPAVNAAGVNARANAAKASGAGFAGTVQTTPAGLTTPPPTAPLTLLGGTK